MFDFEKLEVYQKARTFNSTIFNFMKENRLPDPSIRDQLRRASLSIMLNIAEGSSRFSKKDRRNFYVISRGSVFECVAIIDFLKNQEIIPEEQFKTWYSECEGLSRILFPMIKNLENVSVR